MISRIQVVKHKRNDASFYQGKDFMTEKEIRNLMEEIIRETNISELCSKEGIDANTYYNWSKDFIRIIRGKLLNGDEPVTVDSVTQNLKNENRLLAKLVAELAAEVENLKRKLAEKK